MHDKLMSHDSGLLLKGFRVILPPALRQSFLHDHHKEHTGITKCQLTARTLIYWPSINNEKDYIKQCPTCIRLSYTIPAEINNYLLQGPWQRLGTCFMDWHEKNVYSSSNISPNISSLTTANAVINHLTKGFSLKDIP